MLWICLILSRFSWSMEYCRWYCRWCIGILSMMYCSAPNFLFIEGFIIHGSNSNSMLAKLCSEWPGSGSLCASLKSRSYSPFSSLAGIALPNPHHGYFDEMANEVNAFSLLTHLYHPLNLIFKNQISSNSIFWN